MGEKRCLNHPDENFIIFKGFIPYFTAKNHPQAGKKSISEIIIYELPKIDGCDSV